MSEKDEQVLYHLYKVIRPTPIHDGAGKITGTLQEGEQVYARADTLRTTETEDREFMSKETATEIQHERGWSSITSEINDREDGLYSIAYMKLVSTLHSSSGQFPHAENAKPSGDGDNAVSSGKNNSGDVSPQKVAPQDEQPENQYFVSYSRTEYYFTRDLVVQLRKHGLDIWFDQQELMPGIEWKSEINKGLENCVGLILVVSRASLRSANVAYEWQYAMRQNKPVYLVLAEAVDIKKIELKSDDIDVTQYSIEELVRYARKIIDLRFWFGRRISLLVNHIMEGKTIRGLATIPKPAIFGLQLTAPINVWLIALAFILTAFSDIYLGVLSLGSLSGMPGTICGIGGIISFPLGLILLWQSQKFLTRDEFSVAQMRLLLLFGFGVHLLTIVSLDTQDLPLRVGGVLLVILDIYTLLKLTFLRDGSLRWLRRYTVENTILDQPEVEKRMGGVLLPNIIPGLAIVGLVISGLVQVWYRLTEPPMRLMPEDQNKVPPTYDVLCAGADTRLARKVENALKQYKMKRVNQAESDMTIAIITNHSSEAFLQDVMATQNRLVIILATSIVSNRYFEELQKLQWFDYRTHKDNELYDLARTIFSQEHSYLRGLPPSVGTIILPKGVTGIISITHLIGSLLIVVGGALVGGTLKMLATQNLYFLSGALLILLGGLSMRSGWRVFVETSNVLNRRLSRKQQCARISAGFLPALGAIGVLALPSAFVNTNVVVIFIPLVQVLIVIALIFMLFVFALAVVGNLSIWLPTQSVAKEDASGILFSSGELRKNWLPYVYGSAICGALLAIAAMA